MNQTKTKTEHVKLGEGIGGGYGWNWSNGTQERIVREAVICRVYYLLELGS